MKVFCFCAIFLSFTSWAASPAAKPTKINGERLIKHLKDLSEFGKNPQGGVSRVAYTAADKAGREYVLRLMREAGLTVSIDVAGNLVGTRAGTDAALKPIVFGSHIDSVPEGGNYDGDVGSLGAIEVAQTLNERAVRLRHPLQVIIFQNEEGGCWEAPPLAEELTRRGSTPCRRAGKSFVTASNSSAGISTGSRKRNGNPAASAPTLNCILNKGQCCEQQHIQIGIVEGIVGILDSEVTVEGFANHAGTTPMDQRHDALLSAARFVDKFNPLVTSVPGTSGRHGGLDQSRARRLQRDSRQGHIGHGAARFGREQNQSAL